MRDSVALMPSGLILPRSTCFESSLPASFMPRSSASERMSFMMIGVPFTALW